MGKYSWLVVITILILTVVELALVFSYYHQSRTFQNVANQAVSTLLDLEKEIGYGGLIHNFKNYILRPQESIYKEKAIANYERAVVLVEKLESFDQSIFSRVSLNS